MNEYQTEKIKQLLANRIKELKKDSSYSEIARKCNITAARISDVANNKIDCQLTTLLEIATGLRIHPKEIFNIVFDFDEYYANLDGVVKKKSAGKKK